MNDLVEDRIRAAQTSRLSFMHQQLRNDPVASTAASPEPLPEDSEAPASPLPPAAQKVAAATPKPRVRCQTKATSREHLTQMLQEALLTPMSKGSVGQQVAAEQQATKHGEDSEDGSHHESLRPLIYRPQNVGHKSKDKVARDGKSNVKEDDSEGEDGLCGKLLSCVTGGRKENKR